MGRNHRKVGVGKNCVLCGGNRSAESVEHAPPKVMFLDQTRPKGFEFPACKRCNKGSAEYDQLAAYVAYSQAPDAVQCSAPITNSQKTLVEGFANNSHFHTSKRSVCSSTIVQHKLGRPRVTSSSLKKQQKISPNGRQSSRLRYGMSTRIKLPHKIPLLILRYLQIQWFPTLKWIAPSAC